MDTASHPQIYRLFQRNEEVFANVPEEVIAQLVAAGCDVALVLDPDGVVFDVAFRDSALAPFGLDDWMGKAWIDTVTSESRPKIEALLKTDVGQSISRRRQVNHPAAGRLDLPVEYAILAIGSTPYRVAIGNDLRKLSEVQQRLLQTQVELEGEYRAIREAEMRYRTVFHLSGHPMLVVHGATRRVIDVNPAAAQLLGRSPQKLAGTNFANLVISADRQRASDGFGAVQHTGVSDTLALTLDKSRAVHRVQLMAFRENGESNLLLTLHPAAGDAAPPSDDAAGLHDMIDVVAEGFALTNAAGIIQDANTVFLDRAQILNVDQAVGRPIADFLGASSVDIQILLTKVRDDGRVKSFSTVLKTALSYEMPVLVSAAQLPSSDGEGVIGFLLDESGARDAKPSVSMTSTNQDGSEFSDLVGRVPLKELIRESVDVIEKLCIEAALRQTDNNRAAAAEMLGLSRQGLYIKLKRYNLEDFGD